MIQLEAFAAAAVFLLRIVRGGGHGCTSLPLPWLRWGRGAVWPRAALPVLFVVIQLQPVAAATALLRRIVWR